MINKSNFKRKLKHLNKKVLEQTYFKYDLTNSVESIESFITDDYRKKVLEMRDFLEKDEKSKQFFRNLVLRNILYLGSECQRFAPIEIEKEYNSFKRIIASDYLQLIKVLPPTINKLYENWMLFKPEIVIFSCHGEETELFIQDDEGKCINYSALNIIDFFKTRTNHTKCVILSACTSIKIGEELNKLGLNIVAINKKVSIKTATKFTKYYLKYLNEHSLDYSHVYEHAFEYADELVEAQELVDAFSFEFLKSHIKQ